eukprot:CAMPEP_0171900046 /NCGR_PEP_ID=MMETSP0992-20121227/49573_1 /TAXON_ID=483369 /ORGANISM="non described non described, Strain CCMP2098" /LENGTH=98 /DNA_ID=CAMNT_0012528441 /DNA_START=305 /DNA_END=601 /DNA_ORIENTATION=-
MPLSEKKPGCDDHSVVDTGLRGVNEDEAKIISNRSLSNLSELTDCVIGRSRSGAAALPILETDSALTGAGSGRAFNNGLAEEAEEIPKEGSSEFISKI